LRRESQKNAPASLNCMATLRQRIGTGFDIINESKDHRRR